MNKFKYRNLNNPKVYYNENIVGLLQNYRSAFFRLASEYLTTKQMDKFNEVIRKLYEVMPPEVIPFTNSQFKQVMTAFALMSEVYPIDSLNIRNYTPRELQTCGEVGLTYGNYQLAQKGYSELLAELESSPNSEAVQSYLRSFFRNPNDYSQASEEQKANMLQNAADQLRKQMLRMFREFKEYDEGVAFLEKWVELKPENQYAQKQLEEFKKLSAEKQAGS
jgi:hypothetical protein